MIHQHLRPRGRIIGINAVVAGVAGDGSNKESNYFRSAFIQHGTMTTSTQSESYPLGYGIKSVWLPIKSGGVAARLSASASMVSNLTGSGVLSASLAGIASGVYTPNIGRFINANLTAAASMNSNLVGKGVLRATISIGASPSATDIAQAVWAQSSTPFVNPNTFGKKLNDAGGASNPWEAELSTNNTPGTFGAFIQKLLTVAKFLGMK